MKLEKVNKKVIIASLTLFSIASVATASTPNLKASPFEVGGTSLSLARWIQHLGEPDASGNQNFGLLLSKNTETPQYVAAGAYINGSENINLNEIGFDIKKGSHCGAGAPRFNVQTSDGLNHFLGCAYFTDAPGAMNGWQRKIMSKADLQNNLKAYPPIPEGSTIKAISIMMDEGVDIPPTFSGLAILDNININGTYIGQPGRTNRPRSYENLDRSLELQD